jgi:hypothetical protein
MRPDLEFHDARKSKPAASSLLSVRSIGRLMALVVLSGLALAAFSDQSRPTILPVKTKPALPRWVPPPARAPSPRLRTPGVIVAPQGIDEAMIVTAPSGIDEAMIVNPERLNRARMATAPIAVWESPGSESPAPSQPGPWTPRAR